MELEQLRIFLAAAEDGGFSPAARRLYISHSTVSRTVAALERELGVQLFVRSNRRQRLTSAGKLLADEARALLTQADALREKLAAYKTE
ncbi:MAG: LysR family transcriptional regulator [Oscillospiraceae bacterium]|nr:LysR family transcriptional regulator [Oscillospiraceae bacterium]